MTPEEREQKAATVIALDAFYRSLADQMTVGEFAEWTKSLARDVLEAADFAPRVDEDETRAELETLVRDLAAYPHEAPHKVTMLIDRARARVARLSEPSSEGTQ